MSRFVWLMILLCAVPPMLYPQEPKVLEVYPIRVGHKTGYARFYKQGAHVMLEPRYDYIMEENLPYHGGDKRKPIRSPYRLFELDEQVGILDSRLREVLPERFHRIRVLSNRLLAVEERPDIGFTLIDTAGNRLTPDMRFQDIHTGGDSVAVNLFFQEDGRWGIADFSGKVILPPTFQELRPAGCSGYYKACVDVDKHAWQFVDSLGKPLLEEPMADVVMYSPYFVLGFDGQHWRMLFRNALGLYRAGSEKFAYAERLNGSLAILLKSTGDLQYDVQLYRHHANVVRLESTGIQLPRDVPLRSLLVTMKYVTHIAMFTWYFPLDEALVMKLLPDKGITLISPEGKSWSTPFKWLSPTAHPDIYEAFDQGYGLYSGIERRLLLPTDYTAISPFRERLAVTEFKGEYRLIGSADTGIVIYPRLASRIDLLEGNRARLILGSNSLTVSFRPDGVFTELSGQTGALHVSANADFMLQEASFVAKTTPSPYRGYPHKAKSIRIRKGSEGWLINNDMLQVTAQPVKALSLFNNRLALLFFQAQDYHSPLTSSYRPGQASVRFFDMENKHYTGEEDIAGFRMFDSLYTYTAFMDHRGMMGLIDRSGKALRKPDGSPLRYTYIGPYVAGRARVAMGGQLSLNYPRALEIPYKFEISRHHTFLEEFQLRTSQQMPVRLADAGVYVNGTDVRWGYLDEHGQYLGDISADHISDYSPDSTAYYYRHNHRMAYDRPDADIGLLDFEGRPLTLPIYSNITPLGDYFLVEIDSTPTFYFNQRGLTLFVNPTRLRPFSVGLAQFQDAQSGLWGYLDTSGRMAIPPIFTYARSFSEGRAIVATADNRVACIDREGRVVFQTPLTFPQRMFMGDFHEGRCWFRASADGLWGCFDTLGRVVVNPQFSYQPPNTQVVSQEGYVYQPIPMDFQRGLSVAARQEGNQLRYYLIDTLGQNQISLTAAKHAGQRQATGYIIFTGHNGRMGVINPGGEVIVEARYASIQPYAGGYAAVKNDQGKWGVVDTLGRLTLPCQYRAIDTLSGGFFRVQQPGQTLWRYVDTTGVDRFGRGFEQATPFQDGYALVREAGEDRFIDGYGRTLKFFTGKPVAYGEGGLVMEEHGSEGRRYFLADTSGNNLFGRYFAELSPFRQGVASFRLWQEDKSLPFFGALNRRGVVIVPPKYRNLHIQSDGSIITNPQRYFGLLDSRGRECLPPAYDRLECFEDRSLFRVEHGDQLGYVRIVDGKTVWVWPLQR